MADEVKEVAQTKTNELIKIMPWSRRVHSLLFFFALILLAENTSAYEHPRYLIRASVDTQKKLIQAHQEVTFTNNSSENLSAVYFHVYPNRQFTKKEKQKLLQYASFFKVNPFPEGFQTPQFVLNTVTTDGQAAHFKVTGDDQTILEVPLSKALGSGQSVTLSLDFNVTIPHAYGRFGWHENIFALSRWYPILSVQDKKGWHNYPFYPFHRPFFSESAYYEVELTTANDNVVIHSGELIKEEMRTDGSKVLFINSKQPIRDFTLAMSPDYKIYEQSLGDINIKAYYLPGREISARKVLDSARDMMKFYTKTFGPYPYKQFSIAPVYLGYGGEQMSNLAFIDTRVYDLPGVLDRYLDFLIAHETGHQWLYNVIGLDEYTQMWLEEGVHSYFVLQYLEEKYGPDAEIANWPRWAKRYTWLLPKFTFKRSREVRYKMLSRVGLDNPVVGELSSFQEPSSIFSITYGKGSKVTEMLKDVLGQETFDRIFKRIYTDYQFKNLSLDDFIRLCEEESGKKLDDFFNQWLYTKKRFDVAVDKVRDHEISLRNKQEIVMPVEVKVTHADGQEEMLIWDAAKKQEQLTAQKISPIKKVELDPERKIMDFNPVNNTWPRKINIKPVPIYLPLYDVPIFLPDDSYNFVFGPDFSNGIGVKFSLQDPYNQILYGSTGYDFSEGHHNSKVGYQLNNIFESQTALGFEMANRTDLKGDEDLVSGKVFLRRELWPVPYGLGTINDHVTLYVVRNKGLDQTLILGGTEDARNISYLKKEESIVGTAFHFERDSPYPDPNQGYRIDTFIENSGHFLGATQQFTRATIDTSFYQPVTLNSKAALRLKYGYGDSKDKNLFELGGPSGLRGYDRKEVRGSDALLGSVEYRFPLLQNLNIKLFDNILGIEAIDGVAFFDAGQSWYGDFNESSLKKDAGGGLRIKFTVGSHLEKVILRVDVARAIHDSSEDDPHFWFGVNHAF